MAIHVQAQAVDVHSHIIPQDYVEALARHDALLDEGFPLPKWDVDSHLQVMDDNGITMSVLTMPAPQPWWGDNKEAQSIVRRVNEESARLHQQYPQRFAFAASLPLPDVDAAIEEARYAMDKLGAVGVKLATNVYGQYLGDAVLDPLMAELDKRGAVVIIHPHKPSPVNDSIMKASPLAIYEYPAETTRAVVNMISHGVTSRYPNIKWVVPHCGSFLPLAIERMKGVHPIMMRAGLMHPIDWSTATSNLYFDLAGNLTPDVLSSLLTLTTPDHLLYGSDYPYVNAAGVKLSKANVGKVLKASGLSMSQVEDVMIGNASRLFGFKQEQSELQSEVQMLIRISEIEVYPEYLDEYLSYALTVGETSVREEPGVVAIFPMVTQRDSCQVRIVEIYRDQEAYKAHIATSHFQTYKQGTLHMVKSLDLVDMNAMNPDAMGAIFRKMTK